MLAHLYECTGRTIGLLSALALVGVSVLANSIVYVLSFLFDGKELSDGLSCRWLGLVSLLVL